MAHVTSDDNIIEKIERIKPLIEETLKTINNKE
jgi:hypothetical protein